MGVGMIRDCSIYECEGDLEYCILCLPGRGGDGDTIADFYAHSAISIRFRNYQSNKNNGKNKK
jgi:hypothetical protein